MSTPLAPRLDAARARVELLTMGATVRVLRDADGTGDDVFDAETGGQWLPTEGDYETVYEGPGGIRQENVQPHEATAGGPIVETRWVGKVPFGVEGIRPGDVYVVDESRDVTLAGRRWRIAGVGGSELGVSRRLQLEAYEASQHQEVEPWTSQ